MYRTCGGDGTDLEAANGQVWPVRRRRSAGPVGNGRGTAGCGVPAPGPSVPIYRLGKTVADCLKHRDTSRLPEEVSLGEAGRRLIDFIEPALQAARQRAKGR